MKFKALFALPLASVSLIALAPPAQAANADGLYLGVGTGFSSLKNDDSDVGDFIESGSDDFDVDDDDNVYKAFVGYEYNRYFATEAFYADLGKVELKGNGVSNTDLESKAYGLSLVGKLPITDWFELFVKAGMAKWETDVDGHLGNASVDLDDNDGIDPVYGAGAQLNFHPLLLRAEYERYDFDSDYEVDSFTASVGWQF
ncbi:porin family protein [Salinicola sp. LHM]|uniref:porin family protein n=1 Tax=Salinicola sp. LHM TaxID=3065298 RepID=UPI002ACD90B4|nr:porin family protein [Salinicola sp. LHM]WQH34802.1 porin family protein [Salinicola sp. LHM]